MSGILTSGTLTTTLLNTVAGTDETGAYIGIWVQFLGAIVTMLMAFLTYLAKKVADRVVEKINASEQEKEAVQAILAGMAKAQDEIVRDARAASADGRLTKEEIEAARKVAFEHAIEIAKGPVKDLLISWGRTRVDSVIKGALTKFKG